MTSPWVADDVAPIYKTLAKQRIETFGASVVAAQNKIVFEALGRWLGVEPEIEAIAPHKHRLRSYRVGDCTHYHVDDQIVVSVWDGSLKPITRERADLAYVDEWTFNYKDYSQ